MPHPRGSMPWITWDHRPVTGGLHLPPPGGGFFGAPLTASEMQAVNVPRFGDPFAGGPFSTSRDFLDEFYSTGVGALVQRTGVAAAILNKLREWIEGDQPGAGRVVNDALADPSLDCVWPNRTDPMTGECRIFAGDQSGPEGFTATAGAFGMAAMVPRAEMQRHLTCPSGMVLGRDELCYPRQVLRRDSKFRKWRPGAKPWGTPGQVRALREAKAFVRSGREKFKGIGISVAK